MFVNRGMSCLIPTPGPIIDSFTVSLHSPNGRQSPAVRVVQGDCQWPLENGWNFNRSCKSVMHYIMPRIQCRWGVPNLYLDQPITQKYQFMSHWLFNSHQVVTVYQSSGPPMAVCCDGDKWNPRLGFHEINREPDYHHGKHWDDPIETHVPFVFSVSVQSLWIHT